MDYKPNPTIIKMACELWSQMLSNPKFDALGKDGFRDDPNDSMFMAQGLASVLADNNKATEESLQKFKEILYNLLNSKLKLNNDTKEYEICEEGHYYTSLNVDYHPDCILSKAAKEAGISEEIFPWKTNMYIYKNGLSISYGYGAELLHYYPFDKKWLITTLSGSEINKVIEYLCGKKPEFTVIENCSPK